MLFKGYSLRQSIDFKGYLLCTVKLDFFIGKVYILLITLRGKVGIFQGYSTRQIHELLCYVYFVGYIDGEGCLPNSGGGLAQ